MINMTDIISLAKRRGFVYPTSEIYGGLANCYDYGPLGSQLLKNIKDLWWKKFIETRADMVGIDSQILLHPQTWVASGHVASFTDPLVEDKETHKRYRADHLIETFVKGKEEFKELVIEDLTTEDMAKFIRENQVKSPEGNELTEPMNFSLLFETAIGTVADKKAKAYLRGETAQGIFSQFKNIKDSTRINLPFGVGQIGTSFRNEITTGQFIFRTLEFQQAEIEYFFDPKKSNWEELFKNWQEDMWKFVTETLGVNKENLRWRQHTDKERSFYSKDTWDLEYNYSFGFKELWGIAYRTDYDLKKHMEFSGEDLSITDNMTGEKLVPHVIEPALGINRAVLMVLCDAYWDDKENNRTVLKLAPKLAPYQIAVFPLLKNKEQIVNKAKELKNLLELKYRTAWDDRGNIGKRYLAQDEVGTPFCITIDFDSLEKGTVTVRERDSKKQDIVNTDNLNNYLEEKFR